MNQYLTNVYNILFHPGKAFEDINENLTVSQAAFTLLWVSLIMFSFSCSLLLNFSGFFVYVFCFAFYVFGIYFVWLMSAIFFEYITKIFNKSGKMKLLLCLSAYSLIPLIFIAPLRQLRNLGDMGYFLGFMLEILVYFWIIFLYCRSLSYAYDLPFSRVIMLILLPLVSMLISFFWTIGFLSKLLYIFGT